MTPDEEHERRRTALPTGDGGREACHAWLVLLPAFVLAWPLPAALADVPTTASAGAGWAALASLPAAAMLLVRRVAPLSAGALCLLLLALLAMGLGRLHAVDAFEARRALTVLATGVVLALSGASLGPRGRRILSGGFALACLLWVAPALAAELASVDALGFPVTGVLGNTGDLSEAALPGAVCALALFVSGGPRARVLGLVAALAFAVYAGVVPVLAGVVGFLAAVAVALVLAGAGLGAGRHARIGLVVALVLVATLGLGRALAPGATGGDGAAPAPAAGGVEFRRLTWARVPALVADAPLGVGPGQFERAFPPYRDPAEILVSSIGRREPTPVDVEHPHNDWLLAFAEYGALGGLLFAAFLLAATGRGLRGLARGDESFAGPALASVAVLVNAALNSPLLVPVAAHVVAYPLLGACLGRARAAAPLPGRRVLLPVAVVALLGVRLADAFDLARHGAALAELRDAVVAETNTLDPARARGPISRALRTCPDSVIALEQRVRLPDLERDARRSLYERILQRRPHRRGALIDLANLYARDGQFVEARAHYERVLALDPQNPLVLKNLARLAVDMSLVQPVEDALEAWARAEQLDREWLRRVGAEQLLRGRLDIARVVFARLDPVYGALDANTCFAQAERCRAAGDALLDDALTAGFQLQMAREHAGKQSYSLALRSYRQALQAAARHPEFPDVRSGLLLELAAAEVLAGRRDDAQRTLAEIPKPLKLADVKHRPTWANQVLLDEELLHF
jgi:tetratricopeptide (TPR) repeat protein